MNNNNISGLSTINIELTSRCNKECWCCGRRKFEKYHPKVVENYGDMDFGIIEKLANQIPKGVVVQFHNNGEPLLYPRLGEALKLFSHCYRCFDTNGILLLEKADEIIDNLDTLCISVIQDDPLGDRQFEDVQRFLKLRGNRKPMLVYRLLGYVEKKARWLNLPGVSVFRMLHDPLGSFYYSDSTVRPEVGVCLDLLHHLCVDRLGDVFPCVRFDPYKINKLGNLGNNSLGYYWNCRRRHALINQHMVGNRGFSRLCKRCEFWGVPKG
jgi:radical SAM protein with 4Fe4S-binding SPASM domain